MDEATREVFPWRIALPNLDQKWRRRWGQLANRLAARGHAWPDDERLAWEQVEVERRYGTGPDAGEDPAWPSLEAKEVPWQCQRAGCEGGGWWLSPWGVVNCASCLPPADGGLVVAAGPAAAPPLVWADRVTTAVDQSACAEFRRKLGEGKGA